MPVENTASVYLKHIPQQICVLGLCNSHSFTAEDQQMEVTSAVTLLAAQLHYIQHLRFLDRVSNVFYCYLKI